ncbi:hypothetical protein UFOVP1383_7 [uncultured Caudovirales phage]|uniref:Uncharacterized protein n=1 Tax=uncultured Caudovirales phage TaxID=2100421 RepID=A0A6J5SPM0_9CAUD|nr:hypothetical protein UFOVP848_34 [uncultured Caudovirales phage]CAB4173264.1 hypothetical protein UFOVP945_31 [uncultured Caudovirales phage]CAB4179605.1 hypothetical protein UFOVP1023_11 [uncultured Caudovirales phage]CAB4203817.1 hypothetical protein UFOVP1383_7 [uncultured Caudovirales phage]CAB4216010.1 hypothetical protein UFOVP1477_41 [uncultured Caudovirales phage]
MLNRVLYVISVHDFDGGIFRPARVRLSGEAISSGDPFTPRWFRAGEVVASGSYAGGRGRWEASIVRIDKSGAVVLKVSPHPFPATLVRGGQLEITIDVEGDGETEELEVPFVLAQALEVVEAAERTTSNV